MAWNGSNGSPEISKQAKQVKPKFRWVLVAVAVIVIIAVVLVCAFNQDPIIPPDDVVPPPKQIVAVQPSAKPKQAEEILSVEQPDKIIPHKVLNYAALAAKGKIVITNKNGRELVMTPRKARAKPKYAVFNHSSENRIANLMTAIPGTRFYGTQNYGEKFIEDFKKSCEEPILISPDDDEYTQALKKDMIEIKIELNDRMRKGEDLAQIMTDTRNELQRLGIVKDEIQRSMKAMIKESAKSAVDVDDCIAAANTMLESKGISPIQMTPMLRRSLMRLANVEVSDTEDDDEHE